jgi:hypothetical protein
MPQIDAPPRFPLLEGTISGFYGPGALSAGKDLAAIWQEIEQSLKLPQLQMLLLELQAALALPDNELLCLWAKNAAYDFQSPADARQFFQFFARWIHGAAHEA